MIKCTHTFNFIFLFSLGETEERESERKEWEHGKKSELVVVPSPCECACRSAFGFADVMIVRENRGECQHLFSSRSSGQWAPAGGAECQSGSAAGQRGALI